MKKSKLISGIMALTMAVSGMSFSASAADVGVKVGSATKDPGETFSVDISLSGVPSGGLNAIDFAVGYDSSLIEITDVTAGSIANVSAASSAEGSDIGKTVFNWNKVNGQIVIVYATGADTSSWIKSDGVFATITGKVSSSAKKGSTADLKVSAVKRPEYPDGPDNSAIVFSAAADSVTDYTASATNGAIVIPDEETTEPQPKLLIGDVDCSGDVKIADAVLLARYIAEDDVNVTAQGKLNADCFDAGDGKLTSEDTASLLKFLAGAAKTLPES